jgi:hypothetical protein
MASLKLLSKTFALDLTTSATATGLQLVPNSPTRAFIVAVVNTGTDTAAVSFGTTCKQYAGPRGASNRDQRIFCVAARNANASFNHGGVTRYFCQRDINRHQYRLLHACCGVNHVKRYRQDHHDQHRAGPGDF